MRLGLAEVSVPIDGRQSPTALAVGRGTARLLYSLGFSTVNELALASGRRADLVALSGDGELWIVEIKSSIEDSAPTANGRNIACIATGCSSRPRSTFRSQSFRTTPA
jgi:hypothetical protein